MLRTFAANRFHPPIRSTPVGTARVFACACLVSLVAGCGTLMGGSSFDVVPPESRELAFQERLAPDDGAIVSVVNIRIDMPFEDLSPSVMERHDEASWEAARANLGDRADLVTYSSDGLRVGGFLVRPEAIEGKRLGAVIVNRDGLAGRGLDENEILVELSRYADAGYVAAASAYRGNRLSQGTDEIGGDDVNDVLSLVSLVQRLDYVDPGRVFMVGFGRGGLMTYRALEMGAPIRAAAVISGAADLKEISQTDPELINGFEDSGGWEGLAAIYGIDWKGDQREVEFERRNPRIRSQNLKVPLLVVHGRLDEAVPVAQALCVTTRMRKAGTPIEAVIYGYGDHSLLDHREDWQQRVLDWIDRHDSRAMFN